MTLCLNFPDCPLSGQEHEHSGEAVLMKGTMTTTYTIEDLKKMRDVNSGSPTYAQFIAAAPAICDQLIQTMERKEELEDKLERLGGAIEGAVSIRREALIEEIRKKVEGMKENANFFAGVANPKEDAGMLAAHTSNVVIHSILSLLDSLKKNV